MHSSLCLIVLAAILQQSSALWCYQCVSTQPGCGESLNWLWWWTKVCPEDDDVCVKILEEKDGNTVITRDCLSYILPYRQDIPADRYEGCRPAAKDYNLAHYVNNSIKELDIKRDYYDKTTFCFCFLDHRCNSGSFLRPSVIVSLFVSFFALYRLF